MCSKRNGRVGGRRIVIAFGLLAAAVASGAQEPNVAKTQKNVESLTLPARGAHEECLRIEDRQSLEYTFTSSKPVRFKIYYRQENKVIDSIKKELVEEGAGLFFPDENQTYCLAWSNPSDEPGAIRYRFQLH
jgi:hypothetical protein